MPDKILPRRSFVSGATPTAADLDVNELAINWADAKAFTKNSAGNIVTVPMGGGALSATVTIPASGDQYWASTVLLLNGDGNLNDSSSYGRTVTASGSAAATGTAKFGSNSFSLGGGSLTVPSAPSLDMGSTWVVEAWVNIPTFGTDAGIACRGDYTNSSGWDGLQFAIRAGGNANVTVYFWGSGGSQQIVDCADVLTAGQWAHVAAVRDGAVGRVYVNGTLAGSRSDLNAAQSSSYPIIVGKWTAYRTGSVGLDGLIDDFRVTIGTTRGYTGSTITVPTASFSTGFYSSAQTLPVTITGGGGGGSGLSWSSAPASATATGTAGQIAYDGTYIYVATGSSQWKRAALSTWLPGDPSFSNVVLLMHGDGSLADSSTYSRTVTASGSASAAGGAKFGSNSLLFAGGSDYMSAATSTDFDLGSIYTIEMWVYSTSNSGTQGILNKGRYSVPSNSRWVDFAFSIRYFPNYGIRFYFFGQTNGSSGEQVIDVLENLPLNQWCHVAMVRNGTTGAVYLDGVQKGTISNLSTPAASTEPLEIGRWRYDQPGGTTAEYFSGRIDDLRITKGVARTITVPTAAYPDYA